MRSPSPLTGSVIALMLLLAGCSDRKEPAPANDAASPAPDSAALGAASDGQSLSLTGTVVSAAPNSFVLDYGAGNVVVEMDDFDPFPEGQGLKAGDRVTVSGLADQDLFLNKRIEARSVYVRNLNSYFYASNADEEEYRSSAVVAASATNHSDFTGTVSAIEGREFTLGTGPLAIRVDTSLLADNPLDSEGLQQIKVGDRVFAWGDIDFDAAEGAELKARGLISLVRATIVRTKAPAGSAMPVANQTKPETAPTPAANDAAGPVTDNAAKPSAY